MDSINFIVASEGVVAPPASQQLIKSGRIMH
jgi:hypothetical protein